MSDKEYEILGRLEIIQSKIDQLQQLAVGTEVETEETIDIPISKLEVEVRDINLLSEEIGIQSVEALSSDLELRFPRKVYKWICNEFRVCETSYFGNAFVIKKSTGEIMKWNLIESATRKDHGLPFWSTSPNYHYATNSSEVYFGFGTQDGRSRHVSTCINCRANWGAISFRWDATA